MMRTSKSLEKFTLVAADGATGSVADFLFDDERWTIRYLVTTTGGLLDRRQVLISPMSFREVDWASGRIHLALTRDQIKSSPDIDTDKPVSRQHEQRYLSYYNYPYYWAYPGVWGMGVSPSLMAATFAQSRVHHEPDDSSGDVHLRSVQEVRGYPFQGSDGELGHVDDFIIDDGTWQVRYLVLDTEIWWFGKKVLISPRWATSISWEQRKVHVDISKQAVRAAPEWDGSTDIPRRYESELHAHYARRGYWEQEADRPREQPEPQRLMMEGSRR